MILAVTNTKWGDRGWRFVWARARQEGPLSLGARDDLGAPGKGSGPCQGPETGVSLAHLRKRNKAGGGRARGAGGR